MDSPSDGVRSTLLTVHSEPCVYGCLLVVDYPAFEEPTGMA